jgi:hypothetical protein
VPILFIKICSTNLASTTNTKFHPNPFSSFTAERMDGADSQDIITMRSFLHLSKEHTKKIQLIPSKIPGSQGGGNYDNQCLHRGVPL